MRQPLAAAQSCIGAGENEEALADQFAAANVDGVFGVGGNITAQRNCHEGQAGQESKSRRSKRPGADLPRAKLNLRARFL